MTGVKFGTFLLLMRFPTCLHGVTHPDVDPRDFCYDEAGCGEDTWDGMCRTGSSQSPIDISLPHFVPRFARPEAFFLNQQYATETVVKFFGQNNGHTVQFDVRSDVTSDLQISGAGLGATYTFAQLHFHWGQNDDMGSEHRINGQSYPLELHLVHYKSKYNSLTDALDVSNNDRTAVAVMGMFLTISTFSNPALNPIVSALKSMREPGDQLEFDMDLHISELYPKGMEFARYLGSLTTPTCDEKVLWTVFLRPMPISREQLREFRLLKNDEDASSFNFRKLQPLNGRTVTFHRGVQLLMTVSNPVTLVQGLYNRLRRSVMRFFG